MARAFGKKGAGEAARAGADLHHCDAFERAASAGDARRQVEVEEKVLSEGLPRRQAMTPDDLAQWGQVVDRRHCGAVNRGPSRRGGHRGRPSWS
jgi:hypothetical protein